MDSERVEQAWREDRRRLMDVAYRMLGSISDAEDVVGEAYARFAAADHELIDDARGWLITVTSRLCLDRMRSAETTRRRVRRALAARTDRRSSPARPWT